MHWTLRNGKLLSRLNRLSHWFQFARAASLRYPKVTRNGLGPRLHHHHIQCVFGETISLSDLDCLWCFTDYIWYTTRSKVNYKVRRIRDSHTIHFASLSTRASNKTANTKCHVSTYLNRKTTHDKNDENHRYKTVPALCCCRRTMHIRAHSLCVVHRTNAAGVVCFADDQRTADHRLTLAAPIR